MRLKKIKLSGFKSFAQSTEIHLQGQLLGIVGPNGCGKSNVMDALKWVLGESRANALRGGNLQDVLFNGSALRPAAARASVELLFENDGTLDLGAWGKYTQIAISRVLTRGGASDYFINQIKVRKRDIIELFSGTGLAANAYAIISQGTISNLIEAKPDELRALIEEVAGVARYKDRRRETESRLAQTQSHLVRLNDLLHELSAQILTLKQQAQTAEIFNNKTEQKKETQNLLWRLHFQQAKQEEKKFHLKKNEAENNFEQHQTELTGLIQSIEKARTENENLNQIVQSAQHQFYAKNSQWLILNQEKNSWAQEKGNTEQKIKALENQIQKNNQEKEELALQFENIENQQKESYLILKNTQNEKENYASQIKNLEEDFFYKKKLFEESEQELQKHRQNNLVLNQKKMHLEQNLENLNQRKLRFANQKKEVFDEQVLYSVSKSFEESAQEKKLCEQRIIEKKNQLSVEQENLNHFKKKLNQLEKEKTENLALQNALKIFISKKNSVFLESLSIQTGFEKAVEAALKEKLFAQRLPNLNDFSSQPDVFCYFENPPDAGLIAENSLINYVQATDSIQPILSFWFRFIFVVEDLKAALQQRAQLEDYALLVTPQGELVSRYHVLLPHPKNNYLEMQQKMQKLKHEESVLNEKIMMIKQEMTQSEMLRTEKENLFRKEKEALQILENKMRQMEIQLEKLKTEKKQKEHFFLSWEKEKALWIIEEQNLMQQKKENEDSLKQTALNKQHSEAIFSEKKEDFEKAQKHFSEKKEYLHHLHQKEREEEFKIKTRSNQIHDFQIRLQKNTEECKKTQREIENLVQQLARFNQQEWDEKIKVSLENKLAAESQLKLAKENMEKSYSIFQKLEEKRLLLTQESIPLQNQIADLNLKEMRAFDLAENIKSQFLEHNENEKKLWLTVENAESYSLNHLRNTIQQLNKEIELLGAVNLMALEELQQKLKKEEYLKKQLKDLNEAVETLQNAIIKIDYESEMRFNETLKVVNDFFRQMFCEIFGGGVAILERVENGLAVLAKPAGKKNARLSMLSGGEKALTAIALVFSFFLLNRAPFCLLDEVDAPLDDVNTERFCHLVKKMAEKTQFLFISHNKIAMTMAEQLIGVTMQEQGVSRVVDVNIREAIQSLKEG